MELASLIRDVPDFPVPGILFKDITTLIRDPKAFREAVDLLTAHYADTSIDMVASGVHLRGTVGLSSGSGFRAHTETG